MGTRWSARCGVMVWLVVALTTVALADTGGSMGGGSWGGGGGSWGGGGGGGYSGSHSSGGGSWSSSSGWSSSSSNSSSESLWGSSRKTTSSSSSTSGTTRRYDYDDYDFASRTATPYDPSCDNIGPGFMLVLLGLVFLGFVGKFVSELWDRAMGRDQVPAYMPVFVEAIDVSVLRVAVDGRARRFVQNELARIAKSADTGTDEGRAAMLREVSLLLRRLRDAWVYGGAINEPMRDLYGAKRAFDQHVDDARSRFREEIIRNADGRTITRQASEYRPRADEGEGLILVTMIVAARRELFTVHKIGAGDDLRRALEAASQLTPGNLVAIEIVWQPADDDDRLSSLELEAKYPRPDLIPITNALVGKTFCTHCSGPFPAELVSCPHCGAPAPGRGVPRAA